MKIKVNISAEMPPAKQASAYGHQSICDKVCEYIELCEAGEADKFHFDYLKVVYKKLNDKPKLPYHLVELMEKLTEFMIKHARQDSGDNQLDIEGVDIFKYEGGE
jgi:hypothetical protein